MAILDNIQNVGFFSNHNIDKIVKVWEGSYNKATETSTRGGGFYSTIYVFSITHGFTRPLFLSLLWSEDGGSTWVDGGGSVSGGSTAIAFCDSSNAFIATSSGSGTLHYKLIGYWIDDYDDTNPLVDGLDTSDNKLLFDSRVNFQKIAVEGSTTYSAGTAGSSQTVSVSHSLGYIPNAKVFFEPINNEVWPLVAGGLSNPFLYLASMDEGYMRIYSDRVDITVLRFSNATRNIWYRVYYDA